MEQLIGKLQSISTSKKSFSYNPYLQAKISKIECIHSGLPKTAKSHFGCLGPLRVKNDTSFLEIIQNCYISIINQYILVQNY
jgi:hypothetical protein